MFGSLKKLFSKSAQTAAEERVAPAFQPRPAFAPAPVSEPSSPAGPPAMTTADAISIQLTAIVPKLSGHLSTLVIKAGGVVFALPVNTALSQLSSGKVRIPFGQLRKGVPRGTFADNETHDEVMIELPLSPILAGMNPALLARRAQKRVEVPEEVAGVFGPKGTISAKVAKDVASASAAPVAAVAPSTPTMSAAAPAPPPAAVVPVAPVSPIAPRPVSAPARPPIFTPPATPIAPAIPIAPAVPPTPTPGPIRVTLTPKPPAPTPVSSPLPFAQKPAAPAPSRLPSMGIKPAVPTPVAPAAPVALAAPIAPSVPKNLGPSDVVPVPLSDISEGWPDPVRQEIARGEWDLAMVVFPVSRLDAGMRAGRMTFTWGEIRQWLNPPIGSIPSPHIDVPVELPLKVIAPLFLAARRPVEQQKVNVDESIPDVFAGLKPGAAQVRPAAPAAPAAPDIFASPVPAPVTMAPVKPTAAAPPSPISHAPRPDGLGAIFGQPLKSEWSPAEIMQKVCDLNGVAGSVITMADGLLVAGQVPPPQKAETLAAFLPQIFARLTQYAGEMQLGSLNGLHLSTADAPCAIFKAGKLYLGVIGRVGQSLPEAQLQRIATEIAKRNP